MEAIFLVINLLEKVSVLVATALVLLMLRPAEVWLGETGARASVRRRIFLVLLFGALAIWGTFLGFEFEGMRFNIRMVGIIVAGYLGGAWVGLTVGILSGALSAWGASSEIAPYVFAASVFNGVVAGWWSRRFGTAMLSVAIGAFAIQGLHHVGAAAVMAVADWEAMLMHASKVTLQMAKITANSVGIIVFMGLLSIVRELEAARRDASRSRADARSARLEALQYQLQPHFLFNLLNTLGYLIRTEPVRARELTLDLAEFLRYTLDADADETTLREELVQIERYVDLERARFGEGLKFSVEIEEDRELESFSVPPLILQPLVENAIRHGSRGGEVEVLIRARRFEEGVEIEILDDGPGPERSGEDSEIREVGSRRSLGLENVRERLDRYYRGQAQLRLEARKDGREGSAAIVRIFRGAGEGRLGLADQARRQLRKVVSS